MLGFGSRTLRFADLQCVYTCTVYTHDLMYCTTESATSVFKLLRTSRGLAAFYSLSKYLSTVTALRLHVYNRNKLMLQTY